MLNLNPKIATFLMFSGRAEEAMNFYTSLFDQSEIQGITRYEANGAGQEGTVMRGTFTVKGQLFMCTDSFIKHEFTFTPSISLYVTCDSDEEIDLAFDKLSRDGLVLMPLAAYPFSRKFAWVQDKFGVSWQLDLA